MASVTCDIPRGTQSDEYQLSGVHHLVYCSLKRHTGEQCSQIYQCANRAFNNFDNGIIRIVIDSNIVVKIIIWSLHRRNQVGPQITKTRHTHAPTEPNHRWLGDLRRFRDLANRRVDRTRYILNDPLRYPFLRSRELTQLAFNSFDQRIAPLTFFVFSFIVFLHDVSQPARSNYVTNLPTKIRDDYYFYCLKAFYVV